MKQIAKTVPHNTLGKHAEILKNIYEHKRDLIHNNLSNAVDIHRSKFSHNFDLKKYHTSKEKVIYSE